MGFVRKADNIWPVVNQPNFIIFSIAEFLNRTDVKTTAFTGAEFLPQYAAAGDNADLSKIQKLLAFGKEFRALLLQLVPVNDHHNGGGPYFRHIGTAQGKLAGQKCHGICLATASRAKIGAALAAFFNNGLDYALLQKACSKKLRIPANNLSFLTIIFAVLKIDVVTENLKKSFRAVHALYHGLHFLKRKCRHLVPVIYPAPGIEMFIRGADSTQPRFNPIRNAGQRAIMQKMRNIPPIADINLLPGVVNRRMCVGGVFQFHHTQRYSVYK